MRKFIHKMFLDTSGGTSSKRVITFMAFLLYIFHYFADLFFKVDVSEIVIENLFYVIMIGLGSNTLEHFSVRKNGRRNEDENENYYDEI